MLMLIVGYKVYVHTRLQLPISLHSRNMVMRMMDLKLIQPAVLLTRHMLKCHLVNTARLTVNQYSRHTLQ